MKREIKVESYVKKDGQTILVEDLPPQQRETLALWLKETYLNELFRGQGKFSQEKERD